jgi:hypothetical protein
MEMQIRKQTSPINQVIKPMSVIPEIKMSIQEIKRSILTTAKKM